MLEDVYKKSLELHKAFAGKLGMQSKVPLETRDDLSLAYTPGVAEVVRQIAADPSAAFTYTQKRNCVAVVTDGSAILGLGNLGPLAALPVMEGKAVLFKEFGGVDAFPICLATQDAEEIIKAVKLIAPVFGGINLEDISAPRCFYIEERLKKELDIPVMHDDQHGTAVVVLAGLINALKVKGADKAAVKVVVNGAGAAGVAVVKLLLAYGFVNIVVCDSKGSIYEGRLGLTPEKSEIAQRTNKESLKAGLAECIRDVDIFIGVSIAGILTADLVKTMRPQPIIFAMANPVPEIMPDEALAAGALVVATGRSDFSNQVNNVLAFPGIFRGALDNHISAFTDDMFIRAAENLASIVSEPGRERILPDPFDKRIAAAVASAIQ